jgi:hypothetical protein
MFKKSSSRGGFATLALLAACGSAIAQGPDVTLLDIQNMTNHGPVGGIRSYAIGSYTCNIGNQNLLWTNNGTPGLAMNAYRLHDGRLMQIGLSFAKTACCAAVSTGPCGTCNGVSGSMLGAGCLDIYSASWNSNQSRLGPRSGINAFSGAFQPIPSGSGDANWRRLQVQTSDVTPANWPGALWFVEGVYVGTDDAAAGNSHNNASYKRVNVGAAGDMSPTGSTFYTIPAIRAWRDHGMGANQPDVSVTVNYFDVPGEGRYYYAHKVKDNGNGTWRYDYAIFNLNSDRSGGSFTVPVPSGVTVTNIGFNAPLYHSGEPYSNTPWTVGCTGAGEICWTSPETFAANPNSNALRWGTMYNFWFTADQPPAQGSVTMGLFKPHTPGAVSFSADVPSGPACYANCDGSTEPPVLNIADFSCFLSKFAGGDPYANCDGSTEPPVLNVADFTCFLSKFAGGC